jgi:flagellar basal body-associated protein FliL
MADEKDSQDSGEVKEKKKSNLPLILGIVFVFLLVQVGAVYFVIQALKPEDPKAKKQAEKTEEPAAEEEAPPEEEEGPTTVDTKVGKIVPIEEDMIINGSNPGSYVMVRVSLEFKETEDEELLARLAEFEPKDGKLREPVKAIINREIASAPMVQLQQVAFRDTLEMRIREKIQPYFGKLKVRKIYFSKFIIQ